MGNATLKITLKEKIESGLSFVNSFINKGQERSVKAKKNILATFFIKGFSIVISILLVPMAINYVSVSQYGVWLTINSIVVWFSFFDIGLTRGLRNKLAEAIAKGDDELARIYISSTYAILSVICGVLWILFLIANPFLDWSHILNLSIGMRFEVSILAVIVFTYFCLQFVLRIIATILTADQQPSVSPLLSLLGQILSLILIFILIRTTSGSLILLGSVFCISPIIVYTGATVFFFRGTYRKYRPQFSKIKFKYGKELLSLGLIFFIIQIAGIVQYETANLIIARNFGTGEVTAYNIVYKYFGVLDMIFVIFLAPFWSASTEAFVKNDIAWIRKGIKKYNQLNLGLFFVGCIMLAFSQPIYDLWLGRGKVDISFYLSLWGFLYFMMTTFVATYVAFLNGINALRIQFIACLISPFVYIGVALLLIKYYHLGAFSLFIASIACNFNGLILAPIQYHMIVNKQKKGIWIK
ncbi:MAG: MATE family efflux transporter [Ginsengibacter sp.]